ncbi:hypothetical protein SOVF_159970, partial [Spinacia oleracea]
MFANNSQYQTNLNTVFRYLTSNATNPNGYHQAVSRTGNATVYGHFLCRGDQNTTSCQTCITTATTTDLPTHCPNRKVAIIWYDNCMVRYSNQSFFGQRDSSPVVSLVNTNSVTGNTTRFSELLGDMMNNDIAVRAASGGSQKKFATAFVNYTIFQTLYGLGQCTPDLSPSDCNSCLEFGIGQFGVNQGAQYLQPSFAVHYEMVPFFNLSSIVRAAPPPQPLLPPPPRQSPATNSNRGNRISTTVIVAIVVPIAVSTVVALLVICICCAKNKKTNNYEVAETGEDFTTVESLQYDLATLRSGGCISGGGSFSGVGIGGFTPTIRGKDIVPTVVRGGERKCDGHDCAHCGG